MRSRGASLEIPLVLTVTVVTGLSVACSSSQAPDAAAPDATTDAMADTIDGAQDTSIDARSDVQSEARPDVQVDAHDDLAEKTDAHDDVASADLPTVDRPRFDAGDYACQFPKYDTDAERWRCAPCFASDGVQVGCMACVLPNDPDAGTQVIC